MASYWTNKGKADMLTAGTTGRTFRFGLFTARPASAGVAADLNFVSDVVAGEASGTGYARQTLASVAVTEDDTNDNAKLSANNPSTYTGLNAGTIKGGWVWRRVGGGDVDANDILWCWCDSSDFATTGADVTVNFGTNGIATIS